MAEIIGPIQIRGAIGNLVVDKNGVVKRAPGPKPNQAPRTRENMAEFGTAAKQAKIIREALRVLGGSSDLTARMLKTVRSGIALDDTNPRGKRILSNNEAKQVLPGFELHETPIGSIAPISIKIEANNLKVGKLGGGNLKVEDIYSPPGTTHVELLAVVSKLNIDPEVLDVDSIDVTNVLAKTGDLVLPDVAVSPDAKLLTIVAVAIRFYQEVNSKLYPLNNGAFDTARIVDAIPPA